MKTTPLPSGEAHGPTELRSCARRVLPWLSLAIIDDDLRTMRFPSASTCVVSVTACAEYGAPVTIFPSNSTLELKYTNERSCAAAVIASARIVIHLILFLL